MTDQIAVASNTAPSAAATLEGLLAASLAETSDELARAECFDDEQRAEIYTILRTLLDDSQLHRQWVAQWAPDPPQAASDA